MSIPKQPLPRSTDLALVVDTLTTCRNEIEAYTARRGDCVEHGHWALIAFDQATGELYRLRGLLAADLLADEDRRAAQIARDEEDL